MIRTMNFRSQKAATGQNAGDGGGPGADAGVENQVPGVATGQDAAPYKLHGFCGRV